MASAAPVAAGKSSTSACSGPSLSTPSASLHPSDYTYNMAQLSQAQQMQLYQQYMCYQACTAAMAFFPGFPGFPCPPMPPAGFFPPACTGFYGPMPMAMPFPHPMAMPGACGAEGTRPVVASAAPSASNQAVKPVPPSSKGPKAKTSSNTAKPMARIDADPLAPLGEDDIRKLFSEDAALLKELEGEVSDATQFGGSCPSRAASAASVPDVLFGQDAADLFDLPLGAAQLVPEQGVVAKPAGSGVAAQKPSPQLKARGGVQKKQGMKQQSKQQAQPAPATLEPLDVLAIRDLLVDEDGCGVNWDTGLSLTDAPCLDMELVL